MQAQQRGDGTIGFYEKPKDVASLELGCGRCIGCRLDRARMWSVRCQHEAMLYDSNAFLTLTYDDDHIPPHGSLRYSDIQKFLKRLRKLKRGRQGDSPSGVRFFCAGEYGSSTLRPHYHLLLFNVLFEDAERFGKGTFRSAVLERLWRHGTSLLGPVTPASAAYVARYSLKKVYGRDADAFYTSSVNVDTGEVGERRPEFCTMSRNPGLGGAWFDRFSHDVLPCDYVIVNGVKTRVPRFYFERFGRARPLDAEDVQYRRYLRMREMPPGERTKERRAVCESVELARVQFQYGNRSF